MSQISENNIIIKKKMNSQTSCDLLEDKAPKMGCVLTEKIKLK